MSTKRQAPNELNHENWDQDDPVEEDQTGGFAVASKEVLEKRVIRTAKRRSHAISGEAKKSVFSGFSGFNKSQPLSFEFLSNLTNGSKNNGTSTKETAVSSSSVTSKPSNTISSNIFSMSGTSTPTKSAFGKPASESLFGAATTTVTTGSLFAQSVFTTSKADSTVSDSPFKVQTTVTSSVTGDFGMKTNPVTEKPLSQVSSTMFGTPSTSSNGTNTLFSSTSSNFAAFKKQTSPNVVKSNEIKKSVNNTDNKSSQMTYYSKLQGLNLSVSEWIKKHVEETPLCILTPIFKDYENYLKEIQDEYNKSKEQSKNDSASDSKQYTSLEKSLPVTTGNNVTSPLTSGNKPSIFAQATSPTTSNTTSVFNTSTSIATCTFATSTTPSTGFSLGIKPNSNPSPFTPATTANTSTPFSFGIGKPFSFSTNVNTPKTEETNNEGNENDKDEPPKVEYTPIVEENSVYDKKCKIFVKKDGNFIDKGVGTLYIKKIEESAKHQLLVRANTAIGNVLLNLILGSAVPTQRMGKNNVMMVCIPTPDAKPPPTSILIRVKTSEEADELLETLNKHKA